ncbi:MAG TPA: hypothetical protein VH331_15960 [Allosphingosinicella sp.]|jgi:hypothetical protein|nr:hypothetical protein [Allosphingosinicella sp.]
MHEFYPTSPAYMNLQPLRVPSGWRITWNRLDTSSRAENGDFGGTAIFHAVNEGSRFAVDVTFNPEFDPGGSFVLTILYQPWPRTERGRRKKDEPFEFGRDAEEVHRFVTQSYADLVSELEQWIARCTVWVREGH